MSKSIVNRTACLALMAALLVFLVGATSAKADSVTLTGDYPTLGTALTNSVTETVPATFTSSEFTVPPGFFLFGFTITVSATTIDIAFNGNPGGTASFVPFDGYVFNFTGAPAITGVSLDSASTLPSSEVGLGFTSNEVSVNLEDDTVGAGSSVIIDLTSAAGPPPSVPEPPSLHLLGVGLLALAAAGLRFRQAS